MSDESDADMLERLGDDGMAWATEFCKRFPISVDDALGWFCNAIETAHDKRMRQMAPLRKYYEGYNARIDALEAALRDIRAKVHAHNRGGEMYAGLRDVIRDICDEALNRSD